MTTRAAHPYSRRRVLQGLGVGLGRALVPASMMGPTAALGVNEYADGLTRASPADAGVDARAVLNYIDTLFANDLDLHGFMLYRHGHVVAEGWSWPYASERPHTMHSLTKSVTVCAVGLAISEGRFSLDDRVVEFFPQEAPDDADDKLTAMTVRDLLTMQSGHAESVSGSVFRPIRTSWVDEFFKIPVVHQPGSHFLYSSAVSFMLSAIVTRTTGLAARDYLEPRLFRPLGISGIRWGSSPNGISSGGNGLTWRTADSLKLGILHLEQGRWSGRQILPADWVREATRAQVPAGNYGYQWWVNDDATAYFAVGAFGQYTVVFPEHDAVLALTAGVQRSASLREHAWDYFPDAFVDASRSESDVSYRELESRLENLRLLPEARQTSSRMAEKVAGRIFVIEENEDSVASVRLDFDRADVRFRVADHRGEHVVHVGLDRWIEGETSITGNKLHHQYQADDMRVVAHGYWWDDFTFVMTWQFVETAWVDTVTCRFFEDRISIDRRTNANYAPRVAATLRGAAQRD